jgi:hypothetical protein
VAHSSVSERKCTDRLARLRNAAQRQRFEQYRRRLPVGFLVIVVEQRRHFGMERPRGMDGERARTAGGRRRVRVVELGGRVVEAGGAGAQRARPEPGEQLLT